MNNKFLKLNNFLLMLAILGVLVIPTTTSAASLKVSSGSAVSSGDTSIIEIYLDTEGKNINTIDGSIVLSDTHQGNFEIKDVSLVNSAFTMWPRKPSLGEGHQISFVGGVPGGVVGDRLLLFKVIVKINDSGEFKITPNKILAYLNDGLGTGVELSRDVSVINIGSSKGSPKDNWAEIISNDNTAPLKFEVVLNQDANLFDGKKFISFETTDAESGIDYYEVMEGSYPLVRSGTNYVLIEQDKDLKVVVYAYDKAGNFQVATLDNQTPINWVGIAIVILLVVTLRKVFLKFRNKNRNQNVA